MKNEMKCKREELLGSWFRREIEHLGVEHTEHACFNIDGSFEFTFVSLKNGKIIEQSVEIGDWGLVGNIHFTITHTVLVDDKYEKADLTNADNYQAYEVTKLTEQLFEYQHIVSHESYILTRTMNTIALC